MRQFGNGCWNRVGLHVLQAATVLLVLVLPGGAGSAPVLAAGQTFASHPPVHPLPEPAERPLPQTGVRFVDASRGSDTAVGTKDAPWKTIAHAVRQLQPGDTLCLRGGIYREHVNVQLEATAGKPITLRSFPGELATIDGGLPEFQLSPQTAWEPVAGGAAGEYRSVSTFPEIDGSRGGVTLLGRFADSLTPLHGYRYLTDLRSSNEYFSQIDAGKTEAGSGIYCGPGVFFDNETKRVHVRLSHTRQVALGADNYQGETDPRKLKLIIASGTAGAPLQLENSRYIRVQDVVVRGGRSTAISVQNCGNVEFDGVTALGGGSAFNVRDTAGLRVVHCACRGIAAPWTYRGSLKYRSIEARIFSASGWTPTGRDNRDFELAWSEFTDCVDGVFLGTCRNVNFHHNLVDNVSDDGMFLTAGTAYDGTTSGGNLRIHQNLFRRCLTVFAFGVGHGRQKMTPTGRQAGAGVFIYRNVFDFRQPVMYAQPEEGVAEWTSYGRAAGDHGGPLWEPMTIYHNTVISHGPPFRSMYAAGFGGHLAGGSRREVFNNLFVQATGRMGGVMPPVVLPPSKSDVKAGPKKDDPLAALLDDDPVDKGKKKPKFSREVDPALEAKLKAQATKKPAEPLAIEFRADGNLHWSLDDRSSIEELLKRFRDSADYAGSRSWYAPGWAANDSVGDPQFARLDFDWTAPLDVRPGTASAAVEAGVRLDENWPDPLRSEDPGVPDCGAVPAGGELWRIGQRGRLDVCGNSAKPLVDSFAAGEFLLPPDKLPARMLRTPVAIMTGYPAFDRPLIAFAFHQLGRPVELHERTWLPPAEYGRYAAVIVAGDLVRAKMEPDQYSAADLPEVRRYLEQGGTLILHRGTARLFETDAGRRLRRDLLGVASRSSMTERSLLLPKHAFVRHLEPGKTYPWINGRGAAGIRAAEGQQIIGTGDGTATLLEVPVGRGRLIYVGWDVSASLPGGRSASTVEQEMAYEQQMQILLAIAASVKIDSAPAARSSAGD